MTDARRRIQDYRSLWLLLLLVAASASALISSCGGGGGSSNGALCEQCGDTDGPCQTDFTVVPGPDEPPPCDVTDAANPCPLELICRRKSDSSQQRCFPKDPSSGDVNYQFKCDGSRPGGTAVPQKTPTPTPSPAGTAVPQTCGNDILEGTEVCDTTQLDGETCASQGCQGGILSCRVTCVFNFELCTGIGAGCGQ